MTSPFYLVGPTAVGKTAFAVEVAERCGAEIISADAFQVYRGLDLLTAKPSPEERRRVHHHLIGILPLSAEYNVARFLQDATHCLEEVASRRRPVIIVGGSGLYIRALTHGLSPLPPAQPERRKELETWSLDSLLAGLRTLDPLAAETIDTKNRRRLIRAIEVCEVTGRPYAESRLLWEGSAPGSAANGLLLTRDRADLYGRIERRVDTMIARGVLEEVNACTDLPFSSTSEKVIGLSEFRAYLRGEKDLGTSVAALKTATRQYAKRQMTWFRSKSSFAGVDLSTVDRESLLEKTVARIMSFEHA